MFQLFFSVVSCFFVVNSRAYYLNAGDVCLVSLARDSYSEISNYSRKHIQFQRGSLLMGYSRSLKRIIMKAALKSGRITKSKQDGSREFISILACILAINK
jgi:hypothetical protein